MSSVEESLARDDKSEDLLVNNDGESSEREEEIIQTSPKRICGLKESTYRVVFGVLLVVVIAVSWTGSTQFAKSSYKTTFSAPYFTTWLAQMFYVLIFPIYMLSVPCQSSLTLKAFLRNSLKIIGPSNITWKLLWTFLGKALCFTTIAVVTNFFYLKSLEYLLPATVSAIFASQSAFVYVLSIIFLGETFLFLRTYVCLENMLHDGLAHDFHADNETACFSNCQSYLKGIYKPGEYPSKEVLSLLLSVGGIVLMSYSEGFGESSSLGILFVCIASLGSATYQVAFKRFMATANGSQVAFLFTVIGILDTVLFWPFIFLLRHVNIEQLDWSAIPWVAVMGTALLGLVFSYTVNFGVVFTYPLFISIGTLLGIPLNAIVDTIFRNEDFGKYKIVATLMIFTGFCMLLLPVDKVRRTERQCCVNRRNTVHDISE